MADLASARRRSWRRCTARREASPVEVARAVIAHIERCEPKLQALPMPTIPKRRTDAARASQARWTDGQPLSAIDGVPGDAEGKHRDARHAGAGGHRGVAARAGQRKTRRLPRGWREAGAVLLGKTTMPDYGMLSSGLSSFHPLHAQPVGPEQEPGRLRAPAPARRRPQATARCTSAPTSAARSACRPAGAACSA